MTNRRVLLKTATALVALSVGFPSFAQDGEPTKVVASFSILGDMVEQIGGDKVSVTTLVGRGGDTHVYQPTPADARSVGEAEVLIVNGLEFEGWLERLAEAASFDGTLVVATTGLDALAFEDGHEDHDDHEEHAEEDHHDHDHDEHAEGAHDDHDDEHDHGDEHAEDMHDDHDHDEDHADAHDHDDDHHDEEHAGDHHGHDHGAFDPHAWQSLENAVIYVDNITAALAQADPSNAGTFYENREAYVAEIKALDDEVRAMMAALPAERRKIVTSHDAFQYFGHEYDLTFLAPQGLSTESEASARDVAELIEQIRAEGISAVFVENVADARLLKQIASETGASIGGTLYPGALSDEDGDAPTYLDMIRHNANTLAAALGS